MISVGRILEGAFGLIREHFAAVAIWAGLYLAVNVAILFAVQPIMAQAMNPETMGDPGAMMGAMLPVYALNLLAALVALVIYTAAMRAVLRPQSGGLGFLRVGMDEVRILILTILFAVVSVVLIFGFGMIAGLFGAGFATASDSAAVSMFVTFGIALLVCALFVFILIRFSLAFPLTLHRQQIVIGEAWTLSSGRFWTLFGAALVITLVGFVLLTVVGIFTMGSYFGDIFSAMGDPEAAALAVERQMGTLGTALIVSSVANAIISVIWIALSAGGTATAAKLLLDADFDDAEEVFG